MRAHRMSEVNPRAPQMPKLKLCAMKAACALMDKFQMQAFLSTPPTPPTHPPTLPPFRARFRTVICLTTGALAISGRRPQTPSARGSHTPFPPTIATTLARVRHHIRPSIALARRRDADGGPQRPQRGAHAPPCPATFATVTFATTFAHIRPCSPLHALARRRDADGGLQRPQRGLALALDEGAPPVDEPRAGLVLVLAVLGGGGYS